MGERVSQRGGLLDRLLHYAAVIPIEGTSYRLRRHSDLMPEHIRSNANILQPAPPKHKRVDAPDLQRDGGDCVHLK